LLSDLLSQKLADGCLAVGVQAAAPDRLDDAIVRHRPERFHVDTKQRGGSLRGDQGGRCECRSDQGLCGSNGFRRLGNGLQV
jgi:hypothetical protein